MCKNRGLKLLHGFSGSSSEEVGAMIGNLNHTPLGSLWVDPKVNARPCEIRPRYINHGFHYGLVSVVMSSWVNDMIVHTSIHT